MALGAAELIEEVSEGKITGEEDRYSKTDLWDFAANVEGAQKVIELLTPALEEADPDLLASIEAGFTELEAELEPLRRGRRLRALLQQDDPYPSPTLHRHDGDPAADRPAEGRQLAGLSEDLALVPGALGLS